MSMETQELLVFEVAGREFSIPLSLVEEVVPAGQITPVPNSPPFLLGLTAVRGKVMGVIDASTRYGLGRCLSPYFMICHVRGNITAVAIERAVMAGEVPIRPLNGKEAEDARASIEVDSKFLKGSFELFENVDDGKSKKFRPTGKFVNEIDPDLFVSVEMASKVGEE